MITFDSINDARGAIMDYRADHVAKLPAPLVEKFKAVAASASPVDQIVGTMETLYANLDKVDDAGKGLIGGLAAFATLNAWHGLADDNRGNGIVQAMRRDLGDTPPSGSAWPDASSDPAPVDAYIVADA